MANLFKNLEIAAFRAGIQPRTRQSIDWFRRKAQRLRVPNRSQLMREEPLELMPRSIPGNMFMFFYDPKNKQTLPYYDLFPLVIVVKKAPGGFHGLNLHYLPPLLRARFLDSLLDNTNNMSYDDSTNFRVNYGLLQSSSKMKYFKPCFKHYLTSHVRSRFAYVPPAEWEIATFLPTADFQKASRQQVYSDSRKAV
jgi:hypothetical protein|tara:strand:- start:464 stop:1048 length:585 start_codon:yes stop_codon:yes gene_type:complete